MFAVYHDSLKLQMAEEIVCVCFDEFVYVPTEFLLRSDTNEGVEAYKIDVLFRP